MRTFIFILILLLSSTAIAGESSFQNGKYYGYHKNDKCVFEEPPFLKKPDYCIYTDKRGCCAFYSKELKTHIVFCYEYNHPLVISCDWRYDRLED
jgi:hypothetical protein